MVIRKYKYYFKKPRSEITKDILSWLFVAGGVVIAATSPYFILNILRYHKKFRKYPKPKISSMFDKLRRQGFLLIEKRNNQIYISLTEEGRKKAGFLQINNLAVKQSRKWDKKWRLLIFDIPEKKKIVREALRGSLKQLGFRKFQQSVWICPYDCKAEIELLKDFFALSDKEIKLIVAENIGKDDYWRTVFKLSP